jgi:hypothetical protein
MCANTPDHFVVTPDDKLSYINSKMAHSLAEREANLVAKGIKKRARNIGVDTKAADYIEACRKRGEKGIAHFDELVRDALLTGLVDRTHIINLVDANERASEQTTREHQLAVAKLGGWEDAEKGISLEDIPDPLDDEQSAARAEGWARGSAARQLELGLEGKIASSDKELPAGRRERKTISSELDQSSGNGSVLRNVKRRGRPPGAKNKPKPVVEEAAMQAA